MTENQDQPQVQFITGDWISAWCPGSIEAHRTIYDRGNGEFVTGFLLIPQDRSYPHKFYVIDTHKYKVRFERQLYGIQVIRKLVNPDVDDFYPLDGRITLIHGKSTFKEDETFTSVYIRRDMRLSTCLMFDIAVEWHGKGNCKTRSISLWNLIHLKNPYSSMDITSELDPWTHAGFSIRLAYLYFFYAPGMDLLKADASSAFKSGTLIKLRKLL